MSGTRRRRGRPARTAQREREVAAVQAAARPVRVRKGPLSMLRRNIDSMGGLVVLAAIGGAIVIVVLVLMNSGGGTSDLDPSTAPLMGIEVPISTSNHITEDQADQMQITPGIPPAGGPHFATPLNPGIYDEPVPDGNAVHSLEHGIVWISYNADLVSEAGLETLESIANDFGNDVILSPRAENDKAVGIVSWGRYLVFDEVDEQALRDFIETNVNRSPEPGIRAGGQSMTRPEDAQ